MLWRIRSCVQVSAELVVVRPGLLRNVGPLYSSDILYMMQTIYSLMSKSVLLMIWPCSQGVGRQANTHVKLNTICLHNCGIVTEALLQIVATSTGLD